MYHQLFPTEKTAWTNVKTPTSMVGLPPSCQECENEWRKRASSVHMHMTVGLLYDVVNADFKRPVTGKIFPVYTRIFSVPCGSPRATNNKLKFSAIYLEGRRPHI